MLKPKGAIWFRLASLKLDQTLINAFHRNYFIYLLKTSPYIFFYLPQFYYCSRPFNWCNKNLIVQLFTICTKISLRFLKTKLRCFRPAGLFELNISFHSLRLTHFKIDTECMLRKEEEGSPLALMTYILISAVPFRLHPWWMFFVYWCRGSCFLRSMFVGILLCGEQWYWSVTYILVPCPNLVICTLDLKGKS